MKKYRIMFGSWGVLGTPKYKYQRVGYVHIKHISGGLFIPVPMVIVEKNNISKL